MAKYGEKASEKVEKALHALSELPRTSLLARSKLYATEPWGHRDQPGFVNAVVRVQQRPAREIIESLKAVLSKPSGAATSPRGCRTP